MSTPNGVLITYFSMSGHTRALAEELRSDLHAVTEEIAEPRRRHGFIGSARALIDATLRREPPILPPRRNPADYDIVLIGGPVWAGRMAAPVRSYAKRYGRSAPQVAFFCTEESRGARDAFRDLEALCNRAPVATLVVDRKHLSAEAHRDDAKYFTAMLTLARH